MQQRLFLDHYQIREDDDGSAQELGRSGAAFIYKAIDQRSKKWVALQLIPLASIKPGDREQFEERARSAQKLDHLNIARVLEVGTESGFFVVVSEFLEGETIDQWVVANGPMPPEAALRVGLEVVRALEAAAFFSLTHRALQPSNIMIVPGTAPDGGWPFVKVLNFGLATTESHASETPGASLAPATPPQFASPEQLRNEPLDFRSEVYSLAATMCFLLTGAAPLSNGRMHRFPELRRLPRTLRNLLSAMLSKKPERRPQDPVALEKEMRSCLTTLERRQSFRRKFGLPAAIPRVTRSTTPFAQILRGAIAFAVLLLIAAWATAAFFPHALHFNRATNDIGVPIGVPQTASNTAIDKSSAGQAPPGRRTPNGATNNIPTTAASPMVAEQSAPVVAATSTAQPSPPAQGPSEHLTVEDRSNNESVASRDSSDNESATRSTQPSDDSEAVSPSRSGSKEKSDAPITSSHRARMARTDSNDEPPATRRATYPRRGSFRARVVGRTPDGRPILRLPSGRVVIVTRGYPDEDYYPAPRRRVIVRQPDVDDQVPLQPFNYEPRD